MTWGKRNFTLICYPNHKLGKDLSSVQIISPEADTEIKFKVQVHWKSAPVNGRSQIGKRNQTASQDWQSLSQYVRELLGVACWNGWTFISPSDICISIWLLYHLHLTLRELTLCSWGWHEEAANQRPCAACPPCWWTSSTSLKQKLGSSCPCLPHLAI